MNKTSLLILCNLLIYTVELKSQHIINDRIKNEINKMKIDTAVVYSTSCVGCSASDSCKKERSHYLFLKKKAVFTLNVMIIVKPIMKLS
jgi:hypothetical protein